eukprot:scaffold469_cov391-Prasinococcus_capsulatus_cf.AAC.3
MGVLTWCQHGLNVHSAFQGYPIYLGGYLVTRPMRDPGARRCVSFAQAKAGVGFGLHAGQ